MASTYSVPLQNPQYCFFLTLTLTITLANKVDSTFDVHNHKF